MEFKVGDWAERSNVRSQIGEMNYTIKCPQLSLAVLPSVSLGSSYFKQTNKQKRDSVEDLHSKPNFSIYSPHGLAHVLISCYLADSRMKLENLTGIVCGFSAVSSKWQDGGHATSMWQTPTITAIKQNSVPPTPLSEYFADYGIAKMLNEHFLLFWSCWWYKLIF